MNIAQRSAAIIAGIASIFLTPLVTTAYFRSWGASEIDPVWVRPAMNLLRPLLNFASPADVYQTYGRMFLPTYALLLIAALGLRTAWRPILDREGKRGFNVMIVALIFNIVGSIADYWLGYDILQQPLWGLSFFIGTVLGSLIYVIGSIMVGRSALRSKSIAKIHGWLMILLPPIGVVLTFWGIKHIPAGFVFMIAVGWLILALTYRPQSITQAAQQPLNNEAVP